jgi:hypothetical protein
LNQLDEKIFYPLDDIYRNAKIIFSFGLRRIAEKVNFPVTKIDILEYLKPKNILIL